jgi:hypothetical protein
MAHSTYPAHTTSTDEIQLAVEQNRGAPHEQWGGRRATGRLGGDGGKRGRLGGWGEVREGAGRGAGGEGGDILRLHSRVVQCEIRKIELLLHRLFTPVACE